VGVSSYTQNYPYALAVLEAAKEQGKLVAIGGIHATFRYEEVLRHGFNFAVRGEGELAFAELVSRLEKGKDVRSVKGIAYLSEGKAKSNGVAGSRPGRTPLASEAPAQPESLRFARCNSDVARMRILLRVLLFPRHVR